MTDGSGGHHGVPDDLLNLLGRVTVSAAYVEHVGREIANAFNTPDTGKMQFEKITDVVKERMNWPGQPPWGRVSDADIRAWMSRAKQVMHRRNAYVHGMAHHVAKDGVWEPVIYHARSGRRLPNRADKLANILDEPEAVIRAGTPLWYGLLPQVKEGVFLVFYPLDRRDGVLIEQIGDGYPEVTDEELTAARVHHNRMLGHIE